MKEVELEQVKLGRRGSTTGLVLRRYSRAWDCRKSPIYATVGVGRKREFISDLSGKRSGCVYIDREEEAPHAYEMPVVCFVN